MPAIFGMIAFKMLGGKFCSLLPSDLRYPGAFAKASLPANGRGYAGELTRNVMRALYKQFGCHHCGRKTGKSISDHIPPNLMVHGNTKYLRSFRAVKSQRFYPQCEICIKLQSSALKHGHNPLVLHWNRGWPEPCYFAGFILGAMHFPSETRLALPPSSMLEESTNSDDISGSSLVQLRPEQTTEAIKKMIVKDGPSYITAMEEEMASLRTREREIYGMLQTNSASKCESSSWWKRPSDGLGMKDHDSRAELTIKKLHSELDSISLRKVHLKEDIKWLKQNLR
ncbi:hypothetical protein O6H91_01G050300 [Diphasiastrum complanatum]|nr:hypothetical protein O6H91_01G050300 [Diphasiastrum complanatum]KAJ7568850.1 hypothetical protein O6H91_01G050300 [Diphasiastrum complanatum]